MNKNEPSSVMNTASPKEGKKNLVDESWFAKNYLCSLDFYYTILHLTAAQKIKDFSFPYEVLDQLGLTILCV